MPDRLNMLWRNITLIAKLGQELWWMWISWTILGRLELPICSFCGCSVRISEFQMWQCKHLTFISRLPGKFGMVFGQRVGIWYKYRTLPTCFFTHLTTIPLFHGPGHSHVFLVFTQPPLIFLHVEPKMMLFCVAGWEGGGHTQLGMWLWLWCRKSQLEVVKFLKLRISEKWPDRLLDTSKQILFCVFLYRNKQMWSDRKKSASRLWQWLDLSLQHSTR